MTKEQLENANATVSRIERLKKVLDVFKEKAIGMDASLVRQTSFAITRDTSLGKETLLTINQGELLFLVEAFEKEIAKLENEFRRI